MNRGATPYALRGTSLVLPNGTLNNPSIRLGGERTGLYRSSGGAMSLGVKKVRSAEFSGDGVAIFSDAASITNPGDGNVTPLSLLRNNGMTADNQETRLDIYDVGVPVARQSVFRESVGVYGFKWYGRSGGALHATPAMALSGDKDLAVGRDVLVTRDLRVNGTTRLIGNVTLDGTLTGSATLTNLTVTNNAGVGGTLALGAATSATARLTIGATGNGDGIHLFNSMAGAVVLSMSNAATVGGIGTATSHLYVAFGARSAGFLGNQNDASVYTSGADAGRLLLGAYGQLRLMIDSDQTRFIGDGLDLAALVTSGGAQGRWRFGRQYITPYTKLHIETEWHGDGITLGNNGGHGQGISFNNNVGGPQYADNRLYLFYNQASPGWAGGAMESGLYTSGAATGALLLGGQDVIRIKINRDSIRFTDGDTPRAQMSNGGYWGFRTASPQRTLHVVPASPGDGIQIAGGGGQDPALVLCNNADINGSNAHGWFAMANANGQFIGGSLGSDVVLLSGGSAPGRLLLGSAGTTRMIFDQGGNISVHSANLGVRFGIKQSNSGSAGGLRLYHSDTDAVWWAHYIDTSSTLNILSSQGYAVSLRPGGAVLPSHNQSADLGAGSNNWRYCYFTAIGTQLGGAGPSYQIHLGGDSAAKPSTSTWQVVSDARSKDQRSIRTFRDGLAVVQRLRPIRYRYNGDFITPKGEEGVGFVAEDLVEIVPEMVQRAPVKRRPQDAEAVEMLTVNFHPLFLLLVNAVQELASRVEQLEGSAA
jgi:hypothetical protein